MRSRAVKNALALPREAAVHSTYAKTEAAVREAAVRIPPCCGRRADYTTRISSAVMPSSATIASICLTVMPVVLIVTR